MSRDEFTSQLEPVLGRAYALALHLTRNQADAEDLVQDAALLAYRGFKSFEPGTNFRAWFLKIVTNTFLSSQRRKRPEQSAVSLDEPPGASGPRHAHEQLGGQAGEPAALSGGDALRSVVEKLDAEAVSRAIAELPEEFRAVSSLYFLEDFSYQQIAEALHIPVGTVRSRLHRGRALLQQRLRRLAEDYGLAAPVPGGKGASR